MLVFEQSEEIINIRDLEKFKNIPFNNEKSNISWEDLWCKKIDYFEYQIEELKKTNSLIYEISDYFIGLTEIGIQLLKINNFKNNSITHKRIYSSMKKKDLYNPLNIVVDDASRDYSEYYKDIIFKGKKLEILQYIKENKIENQYLFFVRLLYITPYFDYVNNIIRFNKNEENINKILVNLDFYEEQLKILYTNLYNKKIVPEILFLKKI